MTTDAEDNGGTPQPSPEPVRSCTGCKNGLLQDTGWSNYTVEGTDFFCLVKAHPADGFDAWYGEDKRLLFAAECPRFEAGEPISLDVDGETEAHLTPDERARYDAWEGTE